MVAEAEEPDRRDFLVLAGNAFVAVGAAATLWPFVAQMNPDASTQALASVEIDLAPVKEGQAITAMWRGKPIFIRHRTKEEIERPTPFPSRRPSGSLWRATISCPRPRPRSTPTAPKPARTTG